VSAGDLFRHTCVFRACSWVLDVPQSPVEWAEESGVRLSPEVALRLQTRTIEQDITAHLRAEHREVVRQLAWAVLGPVDTAPGRLETALREVWAEGRPFRPAESTRTNAIDWAVYAREVERKLGGLA
jgi:hypothetical protein